MFLNKDWIDKDVNKLYELDVEEFDAVTLMSRPEHEEFAERIRKSLYYGKLPTDDRPSLPMTEIAVNYIRDAAPKELGKIDMYLASDIGKKAYVSPCSMMLGMIYIERLKHKNPDYLNTVSSSDLFLISMMVASKYLYDEGIDEEVYNDEWAEAADVDTSDVNSLEMDFLRAIDWSLFTQPEEFEKILKSMEESTAYSEGFRRGFWTYTDVMIMLQNAQLNSSLKLAMRQLCKVVVVCSIAYTAGLLTVMASLTTLSLLRTHCIPVTMVISDAGHLGDAGMVTHGSDSLDDVTTVTEETHSDVEENGLATNDDTNSTATENDLPGTVPFPPRIHDDVLSPDSLFNEHDFKSPFLDGLEIKGHESNITDGSGSTSENVSNGLTLPGFLTLTIIKDTVSYFLVALKNDPGHEENEMVPEFDGCELELGKCTCTYSGCVEQDFNEQKTMATFGQCISPYSFWTSLKYYANHYGALNSLKPMMVKSKVICKGHQCQVQTNVGQIKADERLMNSVNQLSRINHCRLLAEDIGPDLRCRLLKESSEGAGPFQLQENVAVDLFFGFHTTGFVLS